MRRWCRLKPSSTTRSHTLPRPPSRTGLNPTSQRELTWWLAKGLTEDEACKRAGLPSSGRLHHFTRTKQFAAELREAITDRLATEVAPRAFKVLEDITMDPKLSPKVRVDAAKALLDRAGYVAKAPAPSALEDEFDRMSRDDLEKLIARIHEQAAAAAKDVTPAEAAAMFE